MMSGTTPQCSIAHILPLRQVPVLPHVIADIGGVPHGPRFPLSLSNALLDERRFVGSARAQRFTLAGAGSLVDCAVRAEDDAVELASRFGGHLLVGDVACNCCGLP